MTVRTASIPLVLLLAMSVLTARAQDSAELLLGRIAAYADSIRSASAGEPDTVVSNAYMRYHFEVERRNVTMLTVPNMFHIAHGQQRDFSGEIYSRVWNTETDEGEIVRHMHRSTVRHRRRTLEAFHLYTSPHLYAVTLIDDHLLSPFHPSNAHFYRYVSFSVDSANSMIKFRPRIANTQMVVGSAIVERRTGRIVRADIEGEYDMVRFRMMATMGLHGRASLRTERTDADMTISFLGNRIQAQFSSVSNLPFNLPDSIVGCDSVPDQLADQLLPLIDHRTNDQSDNLDTHKEQTHHSNNADPLRHVWDIIQDNMLERIRTGFGNEQLHRLRIGPIFNPLYLDYSHSRGVSYRLKMDFQYTPSDNSRLLWEMKMGYSFKQRQIYFDVPLTWHFNRRRDAFIKAELMTGNRITNSNVLDRVKATHRGDTLDFGSFNLDYFRDASLRIVAGYSFSDHLSAQLGAIYHRRSAVDQKHFNQLGETSVYYSFAPLLSLKWKPTGDKGPILTADYEHGLPNVFKSSGAYDRWEFDAAYQHTLPCTRLLSLRGGLGFYLMKSGDQTFLDYTNFRRNNMPAGWRDDYTGEFELLHRGWYNASDFYVRLNATYESPLLCLARIPWVGRLVERERIYVSTLAVRNFYPYSEFGYGLTNRLFSVATFVGLSTRGFEGLGIRLGLEIFSNW